MYMYAYIHLFPSEAIHQRILLHYKPIVLAITKLLYSKILKPTLIKLIVCQQLLIRHIQLKVLLSFIEALGGK